MTLELEVDRSAPCTRWGLAKEKRALFCCIASRPTVTRSTPPPKTYWARSPGGTARVYDEASASPRPDPLSEDAGAIRACPHLQHFRTTDAAERRGQSPRSFVSPDRSTITCPRRPADPLHLFHRRLTKVWCCCSTVTLRATLNIGTRTSDRSNWRMDSRPSARTRRSFRPPPWF